MIKLYEINPSSDWARSSPARKRLEGLVSYLIAAFFSLLWPEAVDMVMLTTLKKQFIEKPEGKEDPS